MDPDRILNAFDTVARERGIPTEQLEKKFAERHAAGWMLERERTPDCLTVDEWDAYYEGILTPDRLEHTVDCPYCSRLQQSRVPDPVQAAAFAKEAAASGA